MASPNQKGSSLPWRYYGEYYALLATLKILRALPRLLHPAVAESLAFLWWHLCPLRKAVVLENLALAFPEKSDKERCRIGRNCGRHFIYMALEFAAARENSPAAFQALVTEEIGREHLEAIDPWHQPFIAVTGHLGNWELMVSYQTFVNGVEGVVLAKPMHNPLIEKWIAQVRKERGFQVIYTSRDMRPILKAVKAKMTIGFVADQDARKKGVFVPFFNRPASTFQGPAYFAHRLNLPILVMACRRQKIPGTYRMQYFPPLYPNPDAEIEEEIERLTRLHVAQLEQAIREAPEQYFWFHRRWKSKPKKKKPVSS